MRPKLAFSALLLLLALLPVAAAAAPTGSGHVKTRIERDLKLDPGGEFRLDASSGSVTVTGSGEAGARVIITSKRSDIERLFEFRFEERPGSVEVTARRKRHFLFEFNGSRMLHFDVRVPTQTRVRVETSGGRIDLSRIQQAVSLETSGGSVNAADVTGNLTVGTSGGSILAERITGDVDVSTSGGSVRLRGVTGRVEAQTSGGNIDASAIEGPLTARTSGGSVDLREVARDLSAETSGGSIRIAGAGGRVDAETSGGSIQADFAPGNASGGTLETSGGGIRVGLDPAVSLDIDAAGGPVAVDVPVRVQGEVSRHRLRGTMGVGGQTLRMHASGGGVRVRPLGQASDR